MSSRHRSRSNPAGRAALGLLLSFGLVLPGSSTATAAVAPAAEAKEAVTVIIEFDGAAALERVGAADASALRRSDGPADLTERYRSLERSITTDQNAVLDAADASGVAISDPRHVTGVLNAVVATVDASQIAALRAVHGVSRVTEDAPFHALGIDSATRAETPFAPAPPATPHESDASTANPEAATPTPAAEAPIVALPGTGSTVAILDTGIDYTLPDLGGGFGEGYKVVDGYDFVNDDGDPMDDHYHGTHVAGIVAATGTESVTGVAPGALLTAWKVLNARGGGELSGILLGLDAASDPSGPHPADVINMSLGGDGDGTDPLSVATGNVVKSGTLVVASAGNAGPYAETIGSPAIAPEVLAVGASITDFRTPSATLVTPMQRTIPFAPVTFSANPPAEAFTSKIVDIGKGTEDDIAAAGDLTGALVVYDGSPVPGQIVLSIATAVRVEAAGAAAALIYRQSRLDQDSDDGGGPVFRELGTGIADVAASTPASALASGDDNRLDTLVAFEITASEYAQYAPAVAAGTAKATIASTDVTDQVASFSSRGQTVAGTIKPDVVAPGYEIRSTVPVAQEIAGNAYRLSGTSMATPYVAGAAAIVAVAHADLDPSALRNLVIGSAVPLLSDAADLSPSAQGAGRVKLDVARTASVFSAPATLGFGQADAVNPKRSLDFTLTNITDAPLTATLSVRPSASSNGTLNLSTTSLVLAPGTSSSASAIASAVVSAGESEVSGQIEIALSDGTSVRIPYLQASRQLQVTSTPSPSTGIATIEVTSFPAIAGPPQLTITPHRGKPYTLQTSASETLPGHWEAHVDEKRIGVYTIAAAATTSGVAIRGSGTFEVIASATSDKTWQQLGRNGAAEQFVPSLTRSGAAMQLTSQSHRPFVTKDYGKSWTHLKSIPVANGHGTLIADPAKGGGFWYFINGTAGRAVLDPSYLAKLLRTDDLGKTWTTLPLPNRTVDSVATAGDGLVAITREGAEVSRDAGRTWTHLDFTWPTSYISGATILKGDLLVSGHRTVWRIPSVFREPGAPEAVATTSGSYSSLSSGPDYAAVGGLGGIATSKDGRNWTDTAFDKRTNTYGLTVLGNEMIASGSSSNYFRSKDLGASWVSHEYPIYGAITTEFARWPDRSDSLVIPIPDAGLFVSDDDGTSFARIGTASTTISGVLATRNAAGKHVAIVADDLGIGTAALPSTPDLSDGVTEWGLSGTEAHSGVGASDVAQDAKFLDTLWRTRSVFGNRVMQTSTNAGKTWTNSGPPGASNILDIESSRTTGGHVVASASSGGERAILVSRDGWATWDTFSHAITTRRLLIDPHVESRLWMAADDGLYVSDDDGRTIRTVVAGEFDAVWVDPADASHIVAGGRSLVVSHDGGATFTPADVGGADMYVSSVTSATIEGKHGAKRTVLFAGSTAFRPGALVIDGRGVMASADGGSTWHNVSAGIGTTAVLSLAVSADEKWLLAGTRQGGLYRASVAELARELR